MPKTKRIGRPPRNVDGDRQVLILTCTDAEWAALLEALPHDTRERYELIKRMAEEQK